MGEQLKPVEASPGTDISLLGEKHVQVIGRQTESGAISGTACPSSY